MKKIASLTLLIGTFLFSASAISSEACSELSRAASKAAQDYRNAAGKVRKACDTSFEECLQSHAQADQMLALLSTANQAMKEACEFVFPITDDSLPPTTQTVLAAIDTFPVSALVPCTSTQVSDYLSIEAGCPNGWTINLPRSNVTVSPVTATQFNYSGLLNPSGSIPVRYEIFGSAFTCTLQFSTSSPISVGGTANFFSSSAGGTLNRLELQVTSNSTPALELSGCGANAEVLEFLVNAVGGYLPSIARAGLSGTFCGVEGPELFGPCP